MRLGLVGTRSLPAPVQLPGLARVGTAVLAAGGLDRADTSTADIVRAGPGAPRRVGALPVPVHDVGAAALGGRLYVFGGGSAAGPTDRITAVTPSGRVAHRRTAAGRAVGQRGGHARRDRLRHRRRCRVGRRCARCTPTGPGAPLRRVATLPHALRYAAAAAVGGRLLVAGGTDGTTARDEILSVDPRRRTACG